MTGSTTDRNAPQGAPKRWPGWLMGVASVAIALHLAAVVIAPLSVQPSSALSREIHGVFSPYVNAAYLNHGYHFFAPEPGPSHLIAYDLELPGGERRSGVFPDREQHQPRLFYHRHFMLSEKLLPLDADRKTYDAIVRSYADHLLAEHPEAVAVEMTYRAHLIVDPREFQEGKKSLDDKSLYLERKLGRFERRPEKPS